MSCCNFSCLGQTPGVCTSSFILCLEVHIIGFFRQKLHEDWLAVERNAQEEFERKKLEEERRRNERLEQEVLLIVDLDIRYNLGNLNCL